MNNGYPGTIVTAPEGVKWGGSIDNHWIQGAGNPANYTGTLQGGTTYYNYVIMTLPWGYTSTSNSSVTVNGGEFVTNWMYGNRYGFFISVDVEHEWEFKDITWTQDGNSYTAKANYVCGEGDGQHTESVDCEVTVDDSDPKKAVYTATVSADDSLDGEEHTDEKTVYTVDPPCRSHHGECTIFCSGPKFHTEPI